MSNHHCLDICRLVINAISVGSCKLFSYCLLIYFGCSKVCV